MKSLTAISWHQLPAEEAAAQLESDPAGGLAQAEVEARLRQFGLNQMIAQKRLSEWARFLLQFHQPLIYILLVAIVGGITLPRLPAQLLWLNLVTALLLGLTLVFEPKDMGERLADAPREGDSFVCAGLRFEIIDMDRTSLDKILIQPEPAQTERLP